MPRKARAKDAAVEVAEPYVHKDEIPEIDNIDDEGTTPDNGRPAKQSRKDAIVRATKKEAKELYHLDEKVFRINPESKSKTAGEKLYETFLDLVSAYETQTYREGKIIKVSRAEDSGTVLVTLDYNGYTIIIPASNLFVLSPSAVRNGEINEAYHYYSSLRLGAKVKFNVLKVLEAKKEAFASRLLAMQEESRQYYINPQADGKPILNKGDKCEATIVYITQSGIGVDIFGAEAFIPSSELSWLNITYADRMNFNIGDVIEVRILDIRPITVDVGNKTFHLVEVDASKKQAEDDPNIENYKKFQIGDKAEATITYVDDKGYYVNLADMRNAFISFTNDDRKKKTLLPAGTVVSVKVTDKNDEGHKIYCEIRGIIKVPM